MGETFWATCEEKMRRKFYLKMWHTVVWDTGWNAPTVSPVFFYLLILI